MPVRQADLCECGQLKDTRAKRCRVCHTGNRAAQGKRDLPSRENYYAQWRLSQPQKYELIRVRATAKRLGLDADDVARRWVEHNGLCDCCGNPPPTTSRLCIEHKHDPPTFRGFTCTHCNVMLGMAKDDPDRLLAGVAYLRRSEPS